MGGQCRVVEVAFSIAPASLTNRTLTRDVSLSEIHTAYASQSTTSCIVR
jgi:hypothetical protein